MNKRKKKKESPSCYLVLLQPHPASEGPPETPRPPTRTLDSVVPYFSRRVATDARLRIKREEEPGESDSASPLGIVRADENKTKQKENKQKNKKKQRKA